LTSIDTNVVVRLVVADDIEQARRAQALLASEDVWISRTVMLETVWVLESTYELRRADTVRVLRGLCDAAGVALESRQAVLKAIDWYERGMDFADALHVAVSRRVTKFATFDRTLVRRARRLTAQPNVYEL